MELNKEEFDKILALSISTDISNKSIAITLAQSNETLKNLGNVWAVIIDDDATLGNDIISNDDLCQYCEDNILGCKNMTSHFMCEGRFCETALESYLETIETELIDKINNMFKKQNVV